jgi:hypothetical protein
MTVGIVSYLSNRGLGTMCHDLRTQLGIAHQMVIPDEGWPMQEAWMNGEEFYLSRWTIDREDLRLWQEVDKIDTLVSIESSFGDSTFRYAKELGMRTILIPMWESYNPHLPAYQNIDLFLCPAWKCFQEVLSDCKRFVPYPVDSRYFEFKQRAGPAKIFVHSAGSGGMNGRKSTRETIEGFIKANVSGTQLIVRCQRPLQEICGIDGATLPANVKVDYGSKADRLDLYSDGDAIICVHKYDGHNLVALEAMASGIVPITTDAPPMNEYWNGDYPLLVKVGERKFAGMINPHCLQTIPNVDDLAAKILWAATHDLSDLSQANRHIVEKSHSWDVLKSRWAAALGMAD